MRTTKLIGVAVLAILGGASVQAGNGDDATRAAEMRTLASRLKYQSGRIRLRDGLATIGLTDAFRYLDPAGTDTLLTGIWGNPPAHGKTLGVIVPAGFDPFEAEGWCVVLSYDEDGYVKDDDAAKIDYADLLKQMQEAARNANAERVKDGYPAVDLIGWAAKPSYDKASHKFYWAKELKFGDSDENTLNYNLRILGRGGVLVLNVVSGMSQLRQVEASVPAILKMVEFDAGNRYADYTPSTDKVATYGLATLVAGGVAAKTGLLKGLFVALLAMKKFVIMGVVGLVAFLKKLLGRSSDPS